MINKSKNIKLVIGIDVSKDKLDICSSDNKDRQTIKNNEKSIQKFAKLLKKEQFTGLLVMESTGGYEKTAHRILCEENLNVHIAHPNMVFHFSKQKGYFAKTDKIDAEILMKYGEQEEITATAKFNTDSAIKKELLSRRAQLIEQISAEKCRLKTHLSSVINRSIKRIIKILEKELELIEKEISQIIENDTTSAKKSKLLRTFKGVGKITAETLICLMPELGALNRAEIACLCGVAPKNNDSGSKNGKRMILGGRFYVRKAIYMASISAIRSNKDIKAYYNRLKEKGKASKVALTAVMRKLIITLNAMLRDNMSWQPRLV